jgi:hypothetical protein
MKARGLSRSREEAGLPSRVGCELRLPLQLSEAQLECYRDVLARRFDVLADPKRPRHSAQRTSEMRSLCAELRKVRHPGYPRSFARFQRMHAGLLLRLLLLAREGCSLVGMSGVQPPLSAAPHATRGGGGV